MPIPIGPRDRRGMQPPGMVDIPLRRAPVPSPTTTRQTPTPQPVPTSLSSPVVPVAGVSLSSLQDTFGASRDNGARSHKGIDIFADMGTPVLAAVGGVVTRAGSTTNNAGNRVWIQDSNGYHHFYAHLSSVNVRPGQQVAQGQIIGGVGDTGNAKGTPPHLHYSVNTSNTRETGEWNPYTYLASGGELSNITNHQWVRADLSLPSDDDEIGQVLSDEQFSPISYRDVFSNALNTVSNILAGGQREPIENITSAASQFASSVTPSPQNDFPVDSSTQQEGGEQNA